MRPGMQPSLESPTNLVDVATRNCGRSGLLIAGSASTLTAVLGTAIRDTDAMGATAPAR